MNLFKLEKLKVKSYSTRNRRLTDLIGTVEVMFNPASFSQQYEILYTKNAGYGATNQQVDYQRSKPGVLNLLLTVDGTGVSEIGLAALLGQKTVTERVKQFLDLTFRVNGQIHEPNFLSVEWGTLIFACRLGKVDITYTTFDRDGSPLRAQLNATFMGDQEVKKQMSMDNLSSPDLTHWVTVAEGDTPARTGATNLRFRR